MDTSRIQEIILKVNSNDAEKTIKIWILHLQPTPYFVITINSLLISIAFDTQKRAFPIRNA